MELKKQTFGVKDNFTLPQFFFFATQKCINGKFYAMIHRLE